MKKNNLSKGVAIDDEGLEKVGGGSVVECYTNYLYDKMAKVGDVWLYVANYNTDQEFIEAIIKKEKYYTQKIYVL